jgi:uncharacterized protein YbjT (DUF2867 family)
MRNNMYADDIPTWFDADGVAREPGDGRQSFTWRAELAEAIAVALTEPGHQGKVYDITGAEAVTVDELARIAREVTGADYRAAPIDDAAWEARWRAEGAADWQVEAGLTSYQALRAGELAVVSGDYRALTGRDPLPLAQIIAALADQLPPAPRRGGEPR